MHKYETPDAQYHRFRRFIKYIVFIGILGVLLVFGGIRLTKYVEGLQVVVQKESFSEFAIRDMPTTYSITPGNNLQPLYTFQQGDKAAETYYTGIVFSVKTDLGSVLNQSFLLSTDSPEYKTILNNCVDHFEVQKEGIPTETIRTKDGKATAVSFSIPNSKYTYFVFRTDEASGQTYQVMARMMHTNLV